MDELAFQGSGLLSELHVAATAWVAGQLEGDEAAQSPKDQALKVVQVPLAFREPEVSKQGSR